MDSGWGPHGQLVRVLMLLLLLLAGRFIIALPRLSQRRAAYRSRADGGGGLKPGWDCCGGLLFLARSKD